MVDADPPAQAGTVIIGAGIVGCSTAYELAERGYSDVVVVDQGAIPETGGSTLHAPGGVGQGGMNKTLVQFAKESRQLYRDLDCYRERGGLDLAFDQTELDFMQLLVDYADAWDVEAELLTPEEVGDLNPHLDTDKIVGALSTPTMGSTKTITLLEKLRKRAETTGITFHERTTVTDIEVEDGRIETVVTDQGRIDTDTVLVAANIWSPLIGQMAGVDIPLVPCEHQFVITEPLPELADDLDRQWEGGFRSRRGSIYAGPQGQGYGVGNYNHEPLVVDPTDIDSYETAMEHPPVNEFYVGDPSRQAPPMRMPASREFTQEDFTEGWQHAVELLPLLEDAEIQEAFNGMFSFTPDGMPILGPSEDVDGFWTAAAVWVTHAGGVAKAMAEWMIHGHPTTNISGCHINRFQPHERSRGYVRSMGSRSYRNVHEIDPMHPRSPLDSPRDLRRTPFYERQQELDANFMASDGWERPVSFESNEPLLEEYGTDVPNRDGWNARYWSRLEGAEHLAVRNSVGVYDVTGLSHIEIAGPDALEYTQSMFPADLDVGIGQVIYTPMLSPQGTILGDMTIVRRGQDRFLILANGGSGGTQQLAWLREHLPDDGRVSVRNRIHELCGLGIWGPESREVLEPIVDVSLDSESFPYLTAQQFHIGSVPVLGVRVSYVGELGWELHTPTDYGGKLWDLVWEAGRDANLVPVGDGALNSLRLEKGYRLWNADINNEYNPYEAGLGFTVDLDSGDFIGKEALIEEQGTEPDRRLTPLVLDEPGDSVFGGMPILDGDEPIGYVTSADYGYSIGAGIAYGYLPPSYGEPGTELAIRFEGERYPASVREEPLFDPEGERLTR